jgi:hypothetical protein
MKKKCKQAINNCQRKRALQMAGSAFVSLDEKGISCSKQKCLEVLEYDKSIGENWFDMCIPSEINAQVKQAYSKVMSGEMEREEYYENEVVTKSGRLIIGIMH